MSIALGIFHDCSTMSVVGLVIYATRPIITVIKAGKPGNRVPISDSSLSRTGIPDPSIGRRRSSAHWRQRRQPLSAHHFNFGHFDFIFLRSTIWSEINTFGLGGSNDTKTSLNHYNLLNVWKKLFWDLDFKISMGKRLWTSNRMLPWRLALGLPGWSRPSTTSPPCTILY